MEDLDLELEEVLRRHDEDTPAPSAPPPSRGTSRSSVPPRPLDAARTSEAGRAHDGGRPHDAGRTHERDRPSDLGRAYGVHGATSEDDLDDAGVSSGHTQIGRAPDGSSAAPALQHHIERTRAYRFSVGASGEPVELGSGRYARAYLGEEIWLQSKTALRRPVAIKILQRGVSDEDALRFQMEKELVERVQGHPNIVRLHASGESDAAGFIPPSIRDRVENDFMVLELCDMSLEERLKGARSRSHREDLLRYTSDERLMRVLEYLLPVASAVEFAHLERGVCHRDIKPANILLTLPNPRLRGSLLEVRLADFNVGKVDDDAARLSLTQLQTVPGTIFFQAPEQETNCFELLVNVQKGSREVDYFEDFFMYITQNDTFQLFNRLERYPVAGADREKKKLYLAKPYEEPSENNVRGKIVKSVDRPADIYSLGATFFYLVTGAYGNPKALYDAFHKFIEYEGSAEQNTVDAYIEHEYAVIQSMRAPREGGDAREVAPVDRFFSYKHYLDGNGELIDREVMKVIGRAMIRNKPDSYCQAWDVHTNGIGELVQDLQYLYERVTGSRGRAGYALSRRASRPSGFFGRVVEGAKGVFGRRG